MLPASTGERTQRAVSRGRPDGRTVEIQRLIGRALRSVCDFEALGERTLWLDCDVLQADGGTRCASITGAWIAASRALDRFGLSKALTGSIAAVSVGIVGGEAVLDLDYEEDSSAETDMNVVMTGDGRLVEVQATAERDPFSRELLDSLLDLAAGGIDELTVGAGGSCGRACGVRLLLASRNENKLRELRAALPDVGDRASRCAGRAGRGRRDVRRQRADQGATRPAPCARRRVGRRRGLGHRGRGARRTARGRVRTLGGRRRRAAPLGARRRDATGARATSASSSSSAPTARRCARRERSRERSPRRRAATRGSATTRSSFRGARRGPWRSSGTHGRPSTRIAPRRRARSRKRSRKR